MYELIPSCFLSIYLSIHLSICLSTIVQSAPMHTCLGGFWRNFNTMIIGWWAIRGAPMCSNLGAKATCGPWGPILCKYAKCYSSYRLHSTMLKLCHSSTVVGVPSGCSGFLGPGSNMGHRAHFMKSYKMLLLLQFIWYNVQTLSQ